LRHLRNLLGRQQQQSWKKIQKNQKETPHGIVLDKKKPSFKTIRSLQQCRSPECRGRIFCRDLQSSKMQAANVLHRKEFGDDEYKRKKKYKWRKRKKKLDDDAENNVEEGKMKKKQKTTSSSSSTTNIIKISSPGTTSVVNPDDARKGVGGMKT